MVGCIDTTTTLVKPSASAEANRTSRQCRWQRQWYGWSTTGLQACKASPTNKIDGKEVRVSVLFGQSPGSMFHAIFDPSIDDPSPPLPYLGPSLA